METGLNIEISFDNMKFIYKDDVFGPDNMEKRYLDDVRKTLKNYDSRGPEVLYTIAMDIGNKKDYEDLVARNLLYGACIYSNGKVGEEPIRSQGHVHAVSHSCGMSTPEMYEIWAGEAYIVMQENTDKNVGKVYAVKCKANDKVIVPPGFAHYTLNANPDEFMAFGAWCIRDYGFDYTGVRQMGGLAFFPIVAENGSISFVHNDKYEQVFLIEKTPREYTEFGIELDRPIYTQYQVNNDKFNFVSNPAAYKNIWKTFIP